MRKLCRRGTESRSERTHPSGHLTGTTFAGAKSRPEYRLHIYSRYSAFGCRRFKIEWVREGKIVSTENTYTFNEKELGVYTVTINASNIDGTTTKDVSVEVVETMPYVVKFPTPSYLQTSTDRYTFADRPVFLRPLLEYFDNPRFEWSVDGQVMEGEVERMFKFTPSAPGEYTVSCTVSEDTPTEKISRNIDKGKTAVTATVKVVCVDKKEQDGFRASGSSKLWNKSMNIPQLPANLSTRRAR